MMSVNLPEESIHSYLEKVDSITLNSDIHIACVNSPWNCTLSGREDSIDKIKHHLDTDQIFATKLTTGVAYHSPAMIEISDSYTEMLGSLSSGRLPDSEISMISSVTGKAIPLKALNLARYWAENLVSPVRFSDSVLGLINHPTLETVTDYLEIGPHSALRRPLKDIFSHHFQGQKEPRYHALLHRSQSAVKTALKTLGELFCLGYPVKITNVNQFETQGQPPFSLLSCPKYPFDHSQRYWKESRLAKGYKFRDKVLGDTLGARVIDWNPLEPKWRNLLSVESMPWIGDHMVGYTSLPSCLFFCSPAISSMTFSHAVAPT